MQSLSFKPRLGYGCHLTGHPFCGLQLPSPRESSRHLAGGRITSGDLPLRMHPSIHTILLSIWCTGQLYIETIIYIYSCSLQGQEVCLPLCMSLLNACIYSYLQLTDQPLDLFVQGKYNKVPTMMVREVDVYPWPSPTNRNNLAIAESDNFVLSWKGVLHVKMKAPRCIILGIVSDITYMTWHC